MKLLISFAAAMILAATSYSGASAQTSTDSLKTAVVRVVNLHCNGDMPAIKKRLLNQDGVDEVTFTDRKGDLSTFTITYHSAAIDQPAIEKAIESTPGCDDQTDTPYRVKKDKSAKKKKS